MHNLAIYQTAYTQCNLQLAKSSPFQKVQLDSCVAFQRHS